MSKASVSTIRAELTGLLKKWGWTKSELIPLCRGGGNSGKGSGYEREVCKRLSQWWTGSKRDDVFWRSSGSGGRAKARGRAGRATMGQHGDIAATDPIGAPLIDLLTIEIKRGYSQHTFQDLIDRPVGGAVQECEKWLVQATESADQAGSFAWLLITRRDRREALVWMPGYLLDELKKAGAFPEGPPVPLTRLRVGIRPTATPYEVVGMVGMTLNDFLAEVTPDHIKEVAKVA